MTARLLTRLGLMTALLLPAAAWGPIAAAGANTLCVNPGGTGGCLGTIAETVAMAASGDTIRIGGGAPYPERLALTKSIGLVGDDPATTIIDGSAGGQVIRITTAITVTLSNLTIRNGQSGAGSLLSQYGGGIHTENADLTLNHVVVRDNHTGSDSCCSGNGGGISSFFGRLTLNDSLVTGNSTAIANDNPGAGVGGEGGKGGGIYVLQGPLTVYHSAIIENFTGNGGSGSEGGGAGGDGGGIASLGGTIIVIDSTISENGTGVGGGSPSNAGGRGGDGGGIFGFMGSVTLDHSAVNYNGTGWGGLGNGRAMSGNGAGLMLHGEAPSFSRLTIDTSTLSENQTGRGVLVGQGGTGGGLYAGAAVTATLINATTAYNTDDSGQAGGGLANAGGYVTIQNSLFANNTTADGPLSMQDCSGTLTSLGYNVMMEPDCTMLPQATGTVGDQFYVRGAIVNPPADNGGPTPTDALPTGSLAIDAANNSACSPTDQRGLKRPVFGGTALRCDVGVFELYRFGARLPLVVR